MSWITDTPDGFAYLTPVFELDGCKKDAHQEWRDRFEGMVAEATDTWYSRASRLAAGGSFPPFYLYYRPSSSSEYGALYLLPEGEAPDPEWQLGDSQGYPSSLTRAAVRARVHRAAWGLPVLPHAERAS